MTFNYTVKFLFAWTLCVQFAWGTCDRLMFSLVSPAGSSPQAECDSDVDRLDCFIKEGFSKFGKVEQNGKTALRLKFETPERDQINKYLNPLRNSTHLFPWLFKLKIQARTMAHHPNVCQSIPLYMKKQKVFGLGPVFIDGNYFKLESDDGTQSVAQLYQDLIMLESGSGSLSFAWMNISLLDLTLDDLKRNSYYKIAVAHELVHSIFQDLYGVEEMQKMEIHHAGQGVGHTRGHAASEITDPTIAWVEGFAEGFEAYIGENYFEDTGWKDVPLVDQFFKQMEDYILTYSTKGKSALVKEIPSLLWNNGSIRHSAGDFTAQFIKGERQGPIAANHFVMKGLVANYIHDNGLAFSVDYAPDELTEWKTNSTQEIYSKEGAVAFIIYSFLRSGLQTELFEMVYQSKPKNLYEFLVYTRDHLSPSKFSLVEPALKLVLTSEGRELSKWFNSMMISIGTAVKDELKSKGVVAFNQNELNGIELPKTFPRPLDLWLEFPNDSTFPPHKRVYGRKDRINLATAPDEHLKDFIQFAHLLGDDVRGFEESERYTAYLILKRTIKNEMGDVTDLDTFIEKLQDWARYYARHGDSGEVLTRKLIEAIRGARWCFKNTPYCIKKANQTVPDGWFAPDSWFED